MNEQHKIIYLARIYGFCSGVATAITIVERALEKYGTPLYVYHQIVHNTFVVKHFEDRGVIFVEALDDIPPGGRVIFSAHGVSPWVIRQARERGLKVIDASCPLVKKVHREAVRFSKDGRQVILIGHKGHQEIVGTSGYVAPQQLHIVQKPEEVPALPLTPETPVAYVTQTTLSQDDATRIIAALKERFSNISGPPRDDICYATQSRQDAVRELAAFCDIIIICGSPNSSNSNRLREIGERCGVPSHIIDQAGELDLQWLDGKKKIGLSSGASVPEYIVEDVIGTIQKHYPGAGVESAGSSSEARIFPLPEV
ncbi:MAG: 4-hydroxy-3-methylbut-2-enyl diphosphate reductase [Candidatus Omnitrophota bacterium]